MSHPEFDGPVPNGPGHQQKVPLGPDGKPAPQPWSGDGGDGTDRRVTALALLVIATIVVVLVLGALGVLD